jgi:Glycine reductase complex selenoprotein A
MDLHGMKVIAIGEREGVTGPSLELLLRSAGAEVILGFTQCFV